MGGDGIEPPTPCL